MGHMGKGYQWACRYHWEGEMGDVEKEVRDNGGREPMNLQTSLGRELMRHFEFEKCSTNDNVEYVRSGGIFLKTID